jgi:extracellular elastinolytic metalloproteinase
LFDGRLFTTPQQPKLEYVARPDGSISLTYPMQIRNLGSSSESHLWVQASVCAHSGKVVSVTDFTAHATAREISLILLGF